MPFFKQIENPTKKHDENLFNLNYKRSKLTCVKFNEHWETSFDQQFGAYNSESSRRFRWIHYTSEGDWAVYLSIVAVITIEWFLRIVRSSRVLIGGNSIFGAIWRDVNTELEVLVVWQWWFKVDDDVDVPDERFYHHKHVENEIVLLSRQTKKEQARYYWSGKIPSTLVFGRF